jgi:hypothetical protein
MTAGYSGTPLAKKLGYKPGHRALWLNAPADYPSLLAPMPADVAVDTAPGNPPYDLIHLFVPDIAALVAGLPKARSALKPDGMIWVSWYKQAAKLPTDMTEAVIRNRARAGDLVDVKVCAVSDIWSGLKLVVRKELRGAE